MSKYKQAHLKMLARQQGVALERFAHVCRIPLESARKSRNAMQKYAFSCLDNALGALSTSVLFIWKKAPINRRLCLKGLNTDSWALSVLWKSLVVCKKVILYFSFAVRNNRLSGQICMTNRFSFQNNHAFQLVLSLAVESNRKRIGINVLGFWLYNWSQHLYILFFNFNKAPFVMQTRALV